MPARRGAAAQPAGIPLEPVRQEKITTRPPPGTGTAAGRRACSASRPAPTARSPAPDTASRVSCSPRRPKSSTVISAVGEHDETFARELGATPVRYGAGLAGRVRALGVVDAVFDAAGKGVLADAIALVGGPKRVITLSDPAAADFGVTLSEPTPGRAPGALDETIALLADGRLRLRAHQSMPMQQAADAHRQLESGTVHQRIILTLN
jgi:hypothetical protein